MTLKIALFTFLFLSPTPLSRGLRPQMVIWNVGQGQWVTYVADSSCIHIDMGGEGSPPTAVQNQCRHKANKLYVTHADMDHIKFIYWGARHLEDLCLVNWPRETLTAKKLRLLTLIPRCPTSSDFVLDISLSYDSFRDANALSHVFWLPHSRALVPGDSTIPAEKSWLYNTLAKAAKILVLGHHGSNTSTSDQLLHALPQLTQAIASARRKRYGHPHPLVVERLRAHDVSMLTTEKWGSIALQF